MGPNFIITALIIALSFLSISATLPTDHSLPAVNPKGRSAVDSELERWFVEHSDVSSPIDLKPPVFEQHVKTYDEVTAAFLRMRFSSSSGRSEKSALESSRSILERVSSHKDPGLSTHPLYPYLLQEIIESTMSSREDSATAYASMESYGERSCPRKDYVLKELGERSIKTEPAEVLQKRLDQILMFRSPRFRREALDVFLDGVAPDKQDILRDRLLKAVRDFPPLLEDNIWLLGDDEASRDALVLKEPFKTFKSVEQNAARQRCRTAKTDFIDAIAKHKSAEHFAAAEAASLKLESCFQRKGQRAREVYWAELEAPMKDSFGFKGAELTRRKLALLRWGRDDFANAKKVFIEIAEEAARLSHPDIESNALFTSARIEENQGNLSQALEYYQRFVAKFPDNEKFLDAEMAMVLINNVLRNNKAALVNALAIIESQSKLALDKRNTSVMSFALFWAGRLQHSIGEKAAAMKNWERVANEYYSTFYGALGHYVLEKVSGRALVLSPARAAVFDPTKLYASFRVEEQPTVYRAAALLKLGLRDEALCEVNELTVDSDERLLAKTLFQFASGEWLASIKSYDALPRSFRNSLAPGFERLLFPRSYETTVQDYSKRIGVDPDLIFAIIRQESVFNPRANSTVGARGLMQLMPSTARGEAKRLATGYIDHPSLTRIKRQIGGADSSLFDADTNIALGVHHVYRLLKKYNNPIFLLTSYNANPRATERWIQNLPTEDFLSFIERIPYTETRQYVKLVLRNYFYYKRWYSGPSQKMEHLEQLARASLTLADSQ
jgi:soluble lytic murein transglycosylase-like protein